MNEKQLRNVTISIQWLCAYVGIILLGFSILSTGQLYANETASQQNKKEVTGKVIDENGNPLPGTTITIDGTTSGVITDREGDFKIEVRNSDVLEVSFIGMETQR